MAAGNWPDWAESWDGRKRCPRCNARLVLVVCEMHEHSVCSRSGWAVEKCDAPIGDSGGSSRPNAGDPSTTDRDGRG